MSDLFIKSVKTENGFLSWKEHDGHQVILDMQQVSAIELGPRAERPGMRVGSEMYFPPLSFEECVSVWGAATRNSRETAGFHLPKNEK